MQTIVRWSLDRRPVIILATILVLVGGLVGATQLRQQLFPDIDFPFVIATIDTTGLDPESVDASVAQPITQALEGSDDVEVISSVSQEGSLRMYVQLAYGSDATEFEESFTRELGSLALPDGVGEPEFAGSFTEQPVVMATMSAENASDLAAAADRLTSELQGTDGVARVDIAGGSDPQIEVRISPAGIERGVTPDLVAQAIEVLDTRANAGVLPGPGGMPIGVVVTGPSIDGAEALDDVVVNGAKLSSVASVTETDSADRGFAVANGQSAVSISVYRATSADEVAVVDASLEVLEDADERLDDGEVSILYESASEIRASLKGLIVEGILGAVFAVVVIFLFLRTVRGTLIAAVSIPTSIVFGLLAAWMLGLTINIITLAGLTIAIGRVIDDGIVVLENIYKHLERGAKRREAMIDGTTEVASAIAASTLATAAVFLPIGLVGGLISEIFLSFSIIVTAALLASFIVAITIVPVLGSFLLRPAATPHDPDNGLLARLVVPATRFGIRHPILVLLTAIIAMVGAFGAIAAGAVPTQFLPDSGTNQLQGTVQLAPGTSPEDAREQLAPLDERISSLESLDETLVSYGIETAASAFDPSIGASTASFFITLDDDADMEAVEADLRSFGSEQFEGGFKVMRIENGPPSGSFQVNVDGDDSDAIAVASEQIGEVLDERADEWGLVDVRAEAAVTIPQIEVRTKVGSGADPAVVEAAVSALAAPVAAGSVGGAPVTVGTEAPLAADPAALARLVVPIDAAGTRKPLGEVATFEQVDAPAFVNRVDGSLSASVTARLEDEDTAGTVREIRAELEDLDLKDVELDFNQGDQQFVNQMFADLGLAMAVAIILVFFVLVLSFGSIAQPLTILAPVMFSFIGSLLALVVTGRALGLPAMIGQLLLIGIVVSNSILLVDSAIRLRRSGSSRDDALIGAAKLRVRPVLMTAAATIAALTPLSLGLSGEGGIISQSLGTVVIGGLLVATLLTLVIVPAVFRLLDRSSSTPIDET